MSKPPKVLQTILPVCSGIAAEFRNRDQPLLVAHTVTELLDWLIDVRHPDATVDCFIMNCPVHSAAPNRGAEFARS